MPLKRCKNGFERSSTTNRCIKKCIRGKVRNPVTNRCKKTTRRCKAGFERVNNRCIKKCVRGKIRNKTTNRCIKKCARGERRNPVTRRCVKIKAARRKAAARRAVPRRVVPSYHTSYHSSHDSPNTSTTPLTVPRNISTNEQMEQMEPISLRMTHNDDLNNTGNACKMGVEDLRRVEGVLGLAERAVGNEDICQQVMGMFPRPIVPEGWTVTRVLGNGAFGVALGTRGPGGEAGAVKILKENNLDDLEREIEMGQEFHKIGLSPKSEKISSFDTDYDYYHAIHMDRLDGVLKSVLLANPPTHRIERIVQKVFDAIERMGESDLSHGDFHWGNIGFVHARDDEVGKLQVIDHGFSSKGMATPELEIAQLLRVADLLRLYQGMSQATFDVLDTKLRGEAARRFDFDPFPEGFVALNQLMDQLMANLHSFQARQR